MVEVAFVWWYLDTDACDSLMDMMTPFPLVMIKGLLSSSTVIPHATDNVAHQSTSSSLQNQWSDEIHITHLVILDMSFHTLKPKARNAHMSV